MPARTKYVDSAGLEIPRMKAIPAAVEPTLGYDGDACIWIDTAHANRVYLVYKRGAGQLKKELT